MSPVRSAKRVTFTYFAVVAAAIIAAHMAIFELTLDHLEEIYTQNRVNFALAQSQEMFADGTQESYSITPFTHAYLGRHLIPERFKLPETLPLDQLLELGEEGEGKDQYYAMRSTVLVKGEARELILVSFDQIFEQSEEQLMREQYHLLYLSLVLLVVSLILVMRISDRLSRPLSGLARRLRKRSPEDFSPIDMPAGTSTAEIEQLVDSLNQYQAQIRNLLERERAFNRYASHELRSPLMVIKGVASLLGQSSDPEFLNKQRQRLQKASNEMNDFVLTLLSLTRDEKQGTQVKRELAEGEICSIVADHAHMIGGRPVSWSVELQPGSCIQAPEATLKILLGNLVKNAFASTERGEVRVRVCNAMILVSDTGSGLGSKASGAEGFGLGLLIVQDICRKYGWEFSLRARESGGCVAEVLLHQEDTE